MSEAKHSLRHRGRDTGGGTWSDQKRNGSRTNRSSLSVRVEVFEGLGLQQVLLPEQAWQRSRHCLVRCKLDVSFMGAWPISRSERIHTISMKMSFGCLHRPLQLSLVALAVVTSITAQVDTQQDPDEIVFAKSKQRPPLLDSPALQILRQMQDGYADIAELVWPSIVTVRAYHRVDAATELPKGDLGWVDGAEPVYAGFHQYSALTGWVVREDGEVLTCNHGLLQKDGSAPDLIDFETHDFQRVIAERVGVEPTVNLAILQGVVWPNSHSQRLPALQWGNSDRLRPGHTLLCFGDPSGPERFLAIGTFVAHPSRDCYQDLLSAFYMQAGLVAHPEAYGGPMIDLAGRVVGILAPSQPAPGVWADSPRKGVELALPSGIVEGLHEAIRTVKSYRSPWLGYAVMSRPEIAQVRGMEAYKQLDKPRNGILIENVFDPSPAFEAGIRPDDWLVTFENVRIFTPVDFQRQLYLRGIGAKVRVEIFRDGKSRSVDLEIQERPPTAMPR